MHAVIFQKMRICLKRASRVDFDHLHIVACSLCDMGKGAPPDAAKSIDAKGDGHDPVSDPICALA
jgi:hypothetical protein